MFAIDNGCGVAAPQRLFQRFQEGAEATGLGLYLSRAFLRAFRSYRPQAIVRWDLIAIEAIPVVQQSKIFVARNPL